MGRYSFKLPDVGEGIAESEIAQWRVKVGDEVKEDQPLVDMLTDKAAVEISSPVSGKILELRGKEGDMAAVGGVLVVIEVEGAGTPEAETAPAPSPAENATPAAPAAAPTAPSQSEANAEPPAKAQAPMPAMQAPVNALPRAEGQKPLASPAVRQRAHDLGIALQYVSGSGAAGQITHADLDGFIARGGQVIAAPAATGLRARSGVEPIKVIGMRRKIAEAMQRAKQRIPHFAYVEEVDVTELEALRQRLNQQHGSSRGKLTLLPFLVRALANAITRYPQINVNYDDEAGIAYRIAALHVGIATQTPSGLVVPVVRHAEALDMWACSSEIKRLANAAREGKAKREELSGSTLTITSLGALGGIVTTPVINAPEVAIIGVNKMVDRPMVRNGQVVIRTMMNLSSCFDHRMVDGFDAAEFIQDVRAQLESPATLFID
jgi:2-oxoisovalerate dehydrogenase E2 component (dihydrolipoyl transacylase)